MAFFQGLDEIPFIAHGIGETGGITSHLPGFVRIAPHFYNTTAEMDMILNVLP